MAKQPESKQSAMKHEGPALSPLLRRLADTPPEWLQTPQSAGGDGVSLSALISDYLESLDLKALSDSEMQVFDRANVDEIAWLRLTLIAVWLLHEEQLRALLVATADGPLRVRLLNLMNTNLRQRARFLTVQSAVQGSEGREELARHLLAALDYRPAGESIAVAEAQLQAKDSMERARLVEAAAAAQERTRKLREAMAKKAAEEAAMKYNRE